MEIKLIEESKNKAVFEIEDELSGLANLLKKELNTDGKVKNAATRVDHPLKGKPTLLIETEGTYTPQAALKSAIDKILKEVDKLKKDLQKELK